MSPLVILIFAIAALVFGFLIVAATRADTFHYERRTNIAAPPAVIFGFINDLRLFQDWSPWAKIDPQCKVVFSGPASGVGTAFNWDGNNKVGTGSMTCVASRPSELIEFRLEFLRPMKAINTARFVLQPEGGGTLVVWSMAGKNNFVGKAFGLIVDCDKMVGKDFEKGLASLKALAESAPQG